MTCTRHNNKDEKSIKKWNKTSSASFGMIFAVKDKTNDWNPTARCKDLGTMRTRGKRRRWKETNQEKSRDQPKHQTPAIAEQGIKTQTFQCFNEPQLSVFQWTSEFAIESGSQKECQQRKRRLAGSPITSVSTLWKAFQDQAVTCERHFWAHTKKIS